MKEHDCIIGLLYLSSYATLVTLPELVDHIENTVKLNNSFSRFPGLEIKEWLLKDYANKRKSTDLTRFDFCPFCGKAIDWKKIKRLKHD